MTGGSVKVSVDTKLARAHEAALTRAQRGTVGIVITVSQYIVGKLISLLCKGLVKTY